MTKWIVVDVEADGPCPGVDMYSMVSLGAVVLDRKLDKTFYGEFAPISENYNQEALEVSNTTRDQHLQYRSANVVIHEFKDWLYSVVQHNEPMVFISDNPAFDWQFANYYLHKYTGSNPFGFSARRIGDIYSGLLRDMRKSTAWKKHRITKHSHNPVDDAKGNAEALLHFNDVFKLNIPL